jgi:hypothetical protein
VIPARAAGLAGRTATTAAYPKRFEITAPMSDLLVCFCSLKAR